MATAPKDNSSSRADLNKHQEDVANMFNLVAKRYDLMNDVLTLGAVRSWRKDVIATICPKPGMKILDLAAGTGTSSLPLLEAGATVFPTDLSYEMVGVGQKQYPQLNFVNADALQLPYGDDVFDAVTISFGLRNVPNTLAALKEMYRVTKPGGQLVICEFSTPKPVWMQKLYYQVALKLLPGLARFSSNKPAYDYLVESIIDWPDQTRLAKLIADAGWDSPSWRNLTQGVVAIHRATK